MQALPKISNRKTKGFTFIELLIVMAIIGILSAMGMPNLKISQSNFQLDSFVKNIHYLAKYLQASAVSYNRIYRLEIISEDGQAVFLAKYKNQEGQFLPLKGNFAKMYKLPADAQIYSLLPADQTSIFFYPDAGMSQAVIIFRNKFGKEMTLTFKESGTAIQIK